MATYVYASSQGQRTHSTRTNYVASYPPLKIGSSIDRETSAGNMECKANDKLCFRQSIYSLSGAHFLQCHLGSACTLLGPTYFQKHDRLNINCTNLVCNAQIQFQHILFREMDKCSDVLEIDIYGNKEVSFCNVHIKILGNLRRLDSDPPDSYRKHNKI